VLRARGTPCIPLKLYKGLRINQFCGAVPTEEMEGTDKQAEAVLGTPRRQGMRCILRRSLMKLTSSTGTSTRILVLE
jgi:hypothetical protein